MKTPIYDFVKKYAESGMLRLHMPGHKGLGPLGCEAHDITEICGADVLYGADGIIKESQNNAALLFGSAKTVYSTEGSSLAIRAMLYLSLLNSGKPTFIAAGRNAHKTFFNACALLSIDIDWLYPEDERSLLSCDITPDALDRYLTDNKPMAVYITSPDYLGNVADIASLSRVCHKHGTILLVDNAHGAYLNFLSESAHPMALGADICCDSAHKTLPVLTGGAYLHISKDAPESIKDQAMEAMSVFASTSPSYLILQSLDLANQYLADSYREKLAEFVDKVNELKVYLTELGYSLVGKEALKISISAKYYGYAGTELSEVLKGYGIEAEFSDPDYMVLMLTPDVGDDGLNLIKKALFSVKKREVITDLPPLPSDPKKILTPREALLSSSVDIDVEDSLSHVLASPNVSCPPAVPILVGGEEIDEQAIACFRYYGIVRCRVINNK